LTFAQRFFLFTANSIPTLVALLSERAESLDSYVRTPLLALDPARPQAHRTTRDNHSTVSGAVRQTSRGGPFVPHHSHGQCMRQRCTMQSYAQNTICTSRGHSCATLGVGVRSQWPDVTLSRRIVIDHGPAISRCRIAAAASSSQHHPRRWRQPRSHIHRAARFAVRRAPVPRAAAHAPSRALSTRLGGGRCGRTDTGCASEDRRAG
jgi:hypothetical protein